MDELRNLCIALTELAIEGKLYLAWQRGGVTNVAATVDAIMANAPKMPRKAKKETAAAPAAANEGILDVKPESVAVASDLTEEQSQSELTKTAKAVLDKFPNPVEGKAEGYHKIKRILAEQFKVAKLTDLVHSQRVQLISTLQGELAAR